jgi:hypothetical protein
MVQFFIAVLWGQPARETHENWGYDGSGSEWRGRELIGKVEAASLSDPERACLSGSLGVVVLL